MTRDERKPTAVSSSATNWKLVPSQVHTQLTKEFVPAVKEVAITGAELLKNYQAVERSSEAYARALDVLAKSSKTADPKAQEYGRELHELLKEYRKVLGYHQTCTKELHAIVNKTKQYSDEEKDKLKEAYSKYQKGEKDILKQQKKGTKTSKDVDQYYETSGTDFLRQQEMRYKYFMDKHKRWFNKYGDLLDKIQSERKPVVNGEVQEEALKVTDEAAKEAEVPVVGNGVHVDEKPQEAAAVVDTVAEVHKDQNGANDDPPFLHSGNSSPKSSISTMCNLPSRRPSNEIIPGVTLLKQERRTTALTDQYAGNVNISSHSQDKFDRVATTQRNDAVQTDAAPPVVVNVPPPVPLPRDERRMASPERNPVVQPVQTKKFEYTGPIIIPAPVPRTREPEVIRHRDPVIVPRTVDAPGYNQRPPSESRATYIPVQERPHYHVESEFNPSVSPSHRPSMNFGKPTADPLVVPTMFNASDYGRTLTVNQDFNATSGEQITINRGDKVILIKSGSRGWIFIQDQATQRTGWIPAPYVSY